MDENDRMFPMAARIATLAALVLAAVGCVGPDPAPDPRCAPGELDTLTPGVFTFATDQPAYRPWFVADQPANGEGFESAVAYAAAEQLGYSPDQVRWARLPFSTAMAPGPKPFDAAISQFSITDQRREIVDFSAPYYDVDQAVLTVAGSAAAGLRSTTALGRLRLGAEAGTTGALTARMLSHATPITVYDSNDQAIAALSGGKVDALVMDLPTAQRAAGDLPDGVVVGQLPRAAERVEQLAMLLDKDSPLTRCLSSAVEALRADGVLDRLQRQWMAATPVPMLTSG